MVFNLDINFNMHSFVKIYNFKNNKFNLEISKHNN